jgi:hypothetical protein
LPPTIHVFPCLGDVQGVHARDKPEHDGGGLQPDAQAAFDCGFTAAE